jgi:hypothetical protein
MSTIRKVYIPCLAVILLLLTLGATPASADSITLTLSVPNSGISGYTGPYATVGVNRTDSTHATITFTSLTNGGYLYKMTDGSSAAVQVNASSWTVGSVTGNDSAGYSIADPPGTSQVDGFGRFNTTIDAPNSSMSSTSTTIGFSLINTGGTWSSASDVLVGNASGYLAAAHVGVCATEACSSFLTTGYAANGNPVPEPASIALFGSGLLSLAGFIRRRRKQISAS